MDKLDMKKQATMLIIYPHWHPANLAGVQRPRLIGNYLKKFGWKPRILTVKPEYFEETPDDNFYKTFCNDFKVTRVKAFPLSKFRIIGDIGLRSFIQLYKEAKQIIRNESIDFIWLPIPSFYNALLGRLLYDKFQIPYGIDYIDPWVRNINNQNNIRSRISQIVAKVLEPIAVKKASVISGVSTSYYEPVLNRNFPEFFTEKNILKKFIINPSTGRTMTHVGMPYGFDPNDHKIVLKNLDMPWKESKNIKPWIYAGAFLPNSHLFLRCLFEAISNLKSTDDWDEKVRLYFIGTGPYLSKRISSYAKDYGLENIIIEERERQPFLNILNYLSNADKVMLIGSTEKHYTASKTFQCLLSYKPLLSILHAESSAVEIIKKVNADDYLIEYTETMNDEDIVSNMILTLRSFQKNSSWNPDLDYLKNYSSKQSADHLVRAINEVININ